MADYPSLSELLAAQHMAGGGAGKAIDAGLGGFLTGQKITADRQQADLTNQLEKAKAALLARKTANDEKDTSIKEEDLNLKKSTMTDAPGLPGVRATANDVLDHWSNMASAAAQRGKEDRKNTEELSQLGVPGHKLAGEIRPKVEEAAKLRDGVAQLNTFRQGIQELQGLIAENGSTELFGDKAGKMGALAKSLQLTLKNLAALGVLSQSDIPFLTKQISDPSSLKSLVLPQGQAQAQLAQTLKTAEETLKNRLSATGYTQDVKSFNSEADIPSDLPKGTVVIIGGRRAVID